MNAEIRRDVGMYRMICQPTDLIVV